MRLRSCAVGVPPFIPVQRESVPGNRIRPIEPVAVNIQLLVIRDAVFVVIVADPIGVIIAGLLLALSFIGGESAQVTLGISDKIAKVFQGILLFFIHGS